MTRIAVALAVAGLGVLGMAQPANAYTATNSITLSGTTYTVTAYSCDWYTTTCAWSTAASTTVRKTFTHYSDVKVNGVNVTVTISPVPSATITGNSTSLVTARRTVTSTGSYMSGVARPSIFSVSVAARARLTSSGVSLNTGWTTW